MEAAGQAVKCVDRARFHRVVQSAGADVSDPNAAYASISRGSNPVQPGPLLLCCEFGGGAVDSIGMVNDLGTLSQLPHHAVAWELTTARDDATAQAVRDASFTFCCLRFVASCLISFASWMTLVIVLCLLHPVFV